jgi:hypothetical protein
MIMQPPSLLDVLSKSSHNFTQRRENSFVVCLVITFLNIIKVIVIAFQLCFRICHCEGPRSDQVLELSETHQLLVYVDEINLLGGNINT